jgi:hypothetical protein
MPQFNAQTAITNLENRLLKAEGQILALRSIVQSTLTTDDVSSGIMRTQLEAIEKALTKEVSNREHDPAARKFIEAAQQKFIEAAQQLVVAMPRAPMRGLTFR